MLQIDNLYNTEEIGIKADTAKFHADRLGNVMQLSEQMRSMNPEESSLFIEDILLQITEKIEAKDMRNERWDIQVDNILGSIGALRNDRNFLEEKVQWSIRSFGEPDVVIQGHTDSTGADEMNESLSQARAVAVLEYLLANGTLTADKLQAVGYGSQRPLASNETTEGRAINRRIDVVIKPLKR